MKRSFIWIITLVFASITSCNAENPDKNQVTSNEQAVVTGGKPVHLTTQQFKQLVFNYDSNKQWKYEGKKPAIVDFYANWCGPCRMVAPILENLAREYDGKIIIYKVNTDEESELAQKLGIQSLPTLIFIPVSGTPQAILGAQPKENLVKAIEEILLISNKK